jgi:hypothetical protein
LSQPLVSRIGASPVWRAGLASAFILGLAGFAGAVVPQACRTGFVICPQNAAQPEAALLPIEPAAAESVPAAEVAAIEPVAPAPSTDTILSRQPASLTKNDLIARTFAALDAELSITQGGELTARKVRTVAIGPDGLPVKPAGEVASEPAPLMVAEAQVEDTEPVSAAAEAAPDTEAAGVEEEGPAASAYAPVRGGVAVVGRQGANVRSEPSTRASDVLFALASGQEVTITQTSKGWHKVVDDRGRSGWIWGELLRR